MTREQRAECAAALRSGNPLLALDLDHVSLATARSAIVLASSPADTPDRSDARVLRIVLSLVTFLERGAADSAMLVRQTVLTWPTAAPRPELLGSALRLSVQGNVVAEISDLDNEPLVRMVGGTVHTIVSHDVIGRLMIQAGTRSQSVREANEFRTGDVHVL